jgi:hypothetical protein
MTSSSKKPKQTSKPKEADAPMATEKETVAKPEGIHSPREKRRKRREDLKSKNSGVGLVIPSLDDFASSSKKILFTEDEEEDKPEESTTTILDEEKPHKEQEDDDDDDAVEEVPSNLARENAIKQRALERETLTDQSKKKKKRKRQPKEEEPKEEELDEDFFAQVDSVMAEEKQKRKEKEEAKPKGTHTTFVFSNEEDDKDHMSPTSVDHNIQIMVLKNPSAKTTASAVAALPVEPLSEEALLYSRGRLINGSDSGTGKYDSKKKRKLKEDPTWKRSKKMNHLLQPRARAHQRRGTGVAAAQFAKRG